MKTGTNSEPDVISMKTVCTDRLAACGAQTSLSSSRARMRLRSIPYAKRNRRTGIRRLIYSLRSQYLRTLFLCGFLLALFFPSIVLGGHGFMSSFGNIEWLPEPGRTPDSAWYKLDAIQEEGKLLLAGDSEAKIQLCLSFAREKLAELEAMVKAENAQAAQLAADRYQTYLTRARALAAEQADQAKKETLAENLAQALLEHRYILSVDYPELPVSTRALTLNVAAGAGEQYQEIIKLLPAKKKGALFFKEEEVRWSLQMAERADEAEDEGVTNTNLPPGVEALGSTDKGD